MATKGGIFTLVNLAEMRRLAKKWIDAIKIRAINGDARVIELSGGNRQKVVIAKSLVQTPKLIIFDEPTRGVDVGAIAEIHQFINQLADEGLAVVVISSHLSRHLKWPIGSVRRSPPVWESMSEFDDRVLSFLSFFAATPTEAPCFAAFAMPPYFREDGMSSVLSKGITPAGSGKAGQAQEVVWNILGHVYWLKAESDGCFIFETLDPPGTFVPPHIHPTQDEFIYMLEGTFDLYLDGAWTQAKTGDLVRMPKGLPHAYYNRQDKPARALFTVSPARRLRELFDQLHDLTDPAEVVRRSKICEVDFLPPGSVPGA